AAGLASEGFDKVRAAAAELAEIVASSGTATDGASDAADRLNSALNRVQGSASGASRAAKQAEEQFLKTADALAEKMFPAEYAMREAFELMDLLDKFGHKLAELQRKAVDSRIDRLFDSAAAGVRDLDAEPG